MFALLAPFLPPFGSILEWFVDSKTGRIVLLVIAGAAAFGIYTWHIETEAAAKATTELVDHEKAADQVEQQRRDKVLEDAQRQAATLVARLAATEKTNAALLDKIRRLSAANDRKPCLDRAGADRLRELGADRQ